MNHADDEDKIKVNIVVDNGDFSDDGDGSDNDVINVSDENSKYKMY